MTEKAEDLPLEDKVVLYIFTVLAVSGALFAFCKISLWLFGVWPSQSDIA